jgi:nucleoside phosphorylase
MKLPTVTLDAMALNAVADELQEARAKFGPMASTHEAYAVIKEEFDEFWEELRKKRPDRENLRMELIQVAAMAIRAAVDCGLMQEASDA